MTLSRKAKNLLNAIESLGGEMHLSQAESGYPDGLKKLVDAGLVFGSVKIVTARDGSMHKIPTIKLASMCVSQF